MEQNPNSASAQAALPPAIALFAQADGAEPPAHRVRHDGWTPERQIAFLETLAACGVVTDACREAGLSAQSAYAFRNRRAGRAFATAWDSVLVHRARGRLSDEVMSRAMNGCIETIRNGDATAERHRFDNRLSMAVLTRLDHLAEAQGEREAQLRAVSEDLDEFLDCVEAGGDVDAFVEARRPSQEPQAAPDPTAELPPQPIVEDQWDRMASLKGCLHYKQTNPLDIDISDLPGPELEGCTMEQILRAHYSGYLVWLDMRGWDSDDHDEEDGYSWDDHQEALSPQAYMETLRHHFEVARKAKLRSSNAGTGDSKPAASRAPKNRKAARGRKSPARPRRRRSAARSEGSVAPVNFINLSSPDEPHQG